MSEDMKTAETMRRAFDVIEESYEFMLAYAAQGRKREIDEGGESQIRQYLKRFRGALDDLASVLQNGSSMRAGLDFLDCFKRDIRVVRSVLDLLLSKPSISSDMIDNTNGLISLRALLTDIFFVDQVVLPGRHGKSSLANDSG
ncbi:MAG: hypothetical protein OXI87_23275 [Albidovulum sp.]|nr:hypothetical protein [Albidovulum sp.]